MKKNNNNKQQKQIILTYQIQLVLIIKVKILS